MVYGGGSFLRAKYPCTHGFSRNATLVGLREGVSLDRDTPLSPPLSLSLSRSLSPSLSLSRNLSRSLALSPPHHLSPSLSPSISPLISVSRPRSLSFSSLDEGRLKSLILSHHSRFACECHQEEIDNDDDGRSRDPGGTEAVASAPDCNRGEPHSSRLGQTKDPQTKMP